jgi:zinc/manganese transport system permease protein
MECVDPGFLRSVSRSGGFVHLTFLGLVVLNLVAGFHALGTLLAVGLMMLPAAAARLWTADITRLLLLASGFGMVSGYGGLVVSYGAGGGNVPAGPAIILAAGTLYLVSLLIGSQGGLLLRLLPRTHLQR